MDWIYYALLIFICLLGGVLGSLLSKTNNKSLLSIFLPFSGAFLLGVLFLHLIPVVYFDTESIIAPGIFVMIGFLIQVFLEQLTQGLEHGHLHVHQHNVARFAWSVMIGLCVHSFIEGMPLANMDLHHDHGSPGAVDLDYFLALILHKFPAALTLGLLLKLSGFRNFTFYVLISIFSIMTPLGSIIGAYFISDPAYVKLLIALVVGSFLHISTTIIFETDKNAEHKISVKKLLAIIIGIGIAYVAVSA